MAGEADRTRRSDLLRSMVKTMAETLMSAEADGVCGAEYGMRSEERTNRRNGYRSAFDASRPKAIGADPPGSVERRRSYETDTVHAQKPGVNPCKRSPAPLLRWGRPVRQAPHPDGSPGLTSVPPMPHQPFGISNKPCRCFSHSRQ
jgi:hypothetical protein